MLPPASRNSLCFNWLRTTVRELAAIDELSRWRIARISDPTPNFLGRRLPPLRAEVWHLLPISLSRRPRKMREGSLETERGIR